MPENSSIKKYNWKNKTILIAEDEISNFRYLEMVLLRTEVTIFWAKDGIEAIELCKKHIPDLILLDIKMPNMDGLEATRIIKSLFPKIPIVIQTAYAMENDEQISYESGCDAYLSKPIRAATLLQIVGNFIDIK